MKMRAAFFKNHGKPKDIEYGYLDTPSPKPHEVLVKVKAAALNHLDLWTLMGIPGVKIPLPHIPGCDIAGEVVELGKNVKGIPLNRPVIVAPGIRCGKCSYCEKNWDSLCPEYKIMGLQTNGGFAQYAVAPAENIIPVSSKLSPEEWASIPLVYTTAWHMLVKHAALQKKETVLIHAAGSGVGSAAIQLAKHIGATVITTVGQPQKIVKAKALGADYVINYKEKDFADETLKITKGRGVNVVIEHIGPETFAKSLTSLAKRGRLVTCGVTSGPTAEINLRYLFSRQLSVQGSYMGSLRELKKVIRLVEKGKLKPVVDKIYPLRESQQALERMISRQNFGKIILIP